MCWHVQAMWGFHAHVDKAGSPPTTLQYKDVVSNRTNQDLRLSSAQAFMIQEPHWAGQAPSASVDLEDSARESRSNDEFCGLPIL